MNASPTASTSALALDQPELEPPSDRPESAPHEPAELEAEVAVQAGPSAMTPAQELRIFISTFFTIFVAEIGDKTQLTTLLMSAESRSPWVVFLGSGCALVLTSLLGVLVGRWLSKRVSIQGLETMTGTLLMIIAVLTLWDVVML